jgi:hypothetical protein
VSLSRAYDEVSGDLTGVRVGSQLEGHELHMLLVRPGTLAAMISAEAEANGLSVFASWEVSSDRATWHRCAAYNNEAETAIAVGTSGNDAAVLRLVEASQAVYGWAWARCNLRVDGIGGTALDLYTVSYVFERAE